MADTGFILYRFESFQGGVEYRAEADVSAEDIAAFEGHTLGRVTRLICQERPHSPPTAHHGGEPLTEEWLASVGFKWHQFDRQPNKQWLLWLGHALDKEAFASAEDLGIEVSSGAMDGRWFCWLRSDASHRYSRFLHVRHLATRGELVRMIEGLTGRAWDPANNLYGAMRTPEYVASLKAEEERLDRRMLRHNPKWRDIEKDDTRGGALPEHMQAAIDGGKAE